MVDRRTINILKIGEKSTRGSQTKLQDSQPEASRNDSQKS